MKALLATIILFSGLASGAQIKLPAEPPERTAGVIISSPLCPSEKLLGKIRYIATLDLFVRTDSMERKFVVDTGYYGSGYWYDEHSNIISKSQFIKGEEKAYLLYSYDDKSRLIKTINLKYNNTPDSLIYNDIENTITWYQNVGPKQPTLINYLFDKTGNLIKQAKHYRQSRRSYEYIYEYDNKKRLTREVHNILDKDPTVNLVRSDTMIYEYIDKENMETVRKHRQINGQKLLKEESIIYVKEQTKVFREYSGPDDTVTDSVELYRADSLVVSDTGSILYWLDVSENKMGSISHFDKNNRIVDFYLPDMLPDKNTYQYKLDSKGNWIEQQVFEDGELLHVRKRIIKYFE